MRTNPALLAALALTTPLTTRFASAGDDCPGRYLAGPPIAGTDGSIEALLTATTPQGAKLFMGGDFQVAGNKRSPHVAAWNGASWEDMGVELFHDNVAEVNDLVYFNGTLFACGEFSTVNGQPAGGLMRWTGLSWIPWTAGASGGGGGGAVVGMHVHNNQLYVHGWFTHVNGVHTHGIARWTGVTFEPVGNFDAEAVWGLTTHNGQLVATGWFESIDGTLVHNIARFNGTQWIPCGEGLSDSGSSLASYDGKLFCAGGKDIALEQNQHDGINYWTGAAWLAMLGSDASSLAVKGGRLYAGGYGTVVNTNTGVASYDGSQWSPLGAGIGAWGGLYGDDVRARGFDLFGGQLAVSGKFSKAGGSPADNIALWNGTSWSRIGAAAASDSRPLSTLGVYNGFLAVAGLKHLINGVATDSVSLTDDGVNFTPIPGQLHGTIEGLTQWHDDLYAFGYIDTVNGQPLEGITRWNGTSWSQLGPGLQATTIDTYARVYDTAEFNGKLICAGYFQQAGPLPVSRIAAWNGAAWSNLGAGTNGYISNLAVLNGNLYATGDFTLAGGVAVTDCARWDGSAWHAAGGDIGSIYDTHVHDGELYACGGDDTIHRMVNNVWQVHSILPHDQGFPFVYELTTYRGELCAVGDLDDEPNQGGRQIMVYRNGAWENLHPDGFTDRVYHAVEHQGHLVCVGAFNAVGETVAPGFTRYKPDQPYIWDQPDDLVNPCPGSTVDFKLQAVGGPILLYRWHRNNVPLVNGPTGTGSTITGATLPHMQIANISSDDDGLYKCVITSQCGDAASRTVRLTTYCYCSPADVGRTGGIPGPDGVLDNNDFIVFIDMFFDEDPQADVGRQGGVPGPDGQWNNNDFVVFIDMFFAGCQ